MGRGAAAMKQRMTRLHKSKAWDRVMSGDYTKRDLAALTKEQLRGLLGAGDDDPRKAKQLIDDVWTLFKGDG